MPELLDFLKLQHDRLKFYNEDFWRLTTFLYGLLTLLLSLPILMWLRDTRPLWWSIAAGWAPALALLVSIAGYIVLHRVADAYYRTAASVLVLERQLGFHEQADGEQRRRFVDSLRFEQGQSTVDELHRQFLARLHLVFSQSRMAVILKIFVAYALFSLVQASVLFIHGITGVNLLEGLTPAVRP